MEFNQARRLCGAIPGRAELPFRGLGQQKQDLRALRVPSNRTTIGSLGV